MFIPRRTRKNITSALAVLAVAGSTFMLAPSYAEAAQQDIYDADAFKDRIASLLSDMDGEMSEKEKKFQELIAPEPEKLLLRKAQESDGEGIAEAEVRLSPMPERRSTGSLEPVPAIAEGTYSFDWQGTPIAQSLYAIAKIAGKNIVINGDIQGKAYMSLKEVTCSQALDFLTRAFNLNWMLDSNTDAIIVSKDTIMLQSREIKVEYIDKEKLVEEMKALGIEDDHVYANLETNTISVTGTPYQIQQAERRIASLDHPVSQCLVLAQLIEIQHGNTLDLGMQYSLPTYRHTASTSPDADTLSGNWLEKLTFSASSQASKVLSKGKVIARPMVMMLNGQEGEVKFGDKVPVMSSTSTTTSTTVTVDYKDVGSSLKIKPTINERTGDITMHIETEVSNITKWVSSQDTLAPQISTRSAVTSAHLKSGESFVIGGLMSASDMDNLSGIPGLMDLPILGKLFSYHSKSKTYAEVYIMITPYIVTGHIDPKQLLREAGVF